MARMNISVPDDVKACMDAAMEPVNWSAVASRAFEIELGEIAKRKQEKDMSDVIARLRASKLESNTAEYQEGHEAGRRWAELDAEFLELNLLDKAEERRGVEGWEWSWNQIPHAIGDNQTADEFWEGIEQIQDKDEDYYNGFVDGALEVYEQVADEI